MNQLHELKFSQNSNTRKNRGLETGKLDCMVFTSIRKNESKFQVGNVFRAFIEKKGRPDVLGYVKLIETKTYERDKIPNILCQLDAAMNNKEFIKVLSNIYVGCNRKTEFVWCVFKYMTHDEITDWAEGNLPNIF
jgi:hypothetical protein